MHWFPGETKLWLIEGAAFLFGTSGPVGPQITQTVENSAHVFSIHKLSCKVAVIASELPKYHVKLLRPLLRLSLKQQGTAEPTYLSVASSSSSLIGPRSSLVSDQKFGLSWYQLTKRKIQNTGVNDHIMYRKPQTQGGLSRFASIVLYCYSISIYCGRVLLFHKCTVCVCVTVPVCLMPSAQGIWALQPRHCNFSHLMG